MDSSKGNVFVAWQHNHEDCTEKRTLKRDYVGLYPWLEGSLHCRNDDSGEKCGTRLFRALGLTMRNAGTESLSGQRIPCYHLN